MTFLINKRTSQSFKERISSKPKNTQASINTALNNFNIFCQELFKRDKDEVIEEFVKAERTAVYDTLQEWINWNLKNGINPSSLKTWFSYVNTYLYYKGLDLSQREIKENLDFPKKFEEELYPLSIEDIQKILSVANYHYKSIILAQLSSLMREGELLQIRKKHLDFDGKRIIIHIPPALTKLKRARTTFLSIEASKMIRPKLKKLEDEDFVWSKTDNVDFSTHGYEQALARYCKKTGLEMKYESNGRRKITSHSFRAFGITKISRHDPNFAKKLAGQKGYLLQYDRMSDEEKLEKYLEFESDLLIYDQSRQHAEIEKLKKENSKLNIDHEVIAELSDRIIQLEKKLSKK